jgi:hypothetical protein
MRRGQASSNVTLEIAVRMSIRLGATPIWKTDLNAGRFRHVDVSDATGVIATGTLPGGFWCSNAVNGGGQGGPCSQFAPP